MLQALFCKELLSAAQSPAAADAGGVEVRPGLRVWGGQRRSVAEATLCVLADALGAPPPPAAATASTARVADVRTAVVLELHEDKAMRLPVYAARDSTPPGGAPLTMFAVLGCVLDHVESVSSFSAAARASAWQPRYTAVNLGPVAEFSSRVIQIMQDLHSSSRLVPAVCALLVAPPPVASTQPDER